MNSLLAMLGIPAKRDPFNRGNKGKHENEAKVPIKLRLYLRAQKRVVVPAEPTTSTFRSRDGKKSYRVFSDGSYRLMKMEKGRRIIAV